MRQCGATLLRRFGTPNLLDVPQREVQELGRRVVVRDVPPRLERFAQLAIQALDGVRRVEHAADRHGIGERRAGTRLAGRLIDRPQQRRERLAVDITHVVQALAHEVHHTRVDRRLREGGVQRLGEARGAVDERDEYVGDPVALQLAEDAVPEGDPRSLRAPDLTRSLYFGIISDHVAPFYACAEPIVTKLQTNLNLLEAAVAKRARDFVLRQDHAGHWYYEDVRTGTTSSATDKQTATMGMQLEIGMATSQERSLMITQLGLAGVDAGQVATSVKTIAELKKTTELYATATSVGSPKEA